MFRALVSIMVLTAADLAAAQAPSDADRMALDATHGIAPQPPRVADLYRRARPIASETFVGMLVCEASVDGDDWDGADPNGPVRRYMGRVELDAEVRLPHRDDVVRFHGPDDTNRITFAVGGVELRRGDHQTIELTDRDMLSSDSIGHVEFEFVGSLPVRATYERGAIECRGIPADAIASKIEDAIEAADEALDDLERDSRPDRAIVGFRDPDADPAEAGLAIYEIARYAGLADPRFLERRDALRSREAAFFAGTAALVRDLQAAATAPGSPVALPGTQVELVVEALDCEVEDVIELHAELGLDTPMECALRLTFRNRGSTTTLAWALHAVDDLGATLPMTRMGLVDESGIHRIRSVRLATGETRVIVACPTLTCP